MDIVEGLMTRTSIRRYGEAPISKEDEVAILKAAMQAPSAHNFQPWEFVVIRDMDLINEITSFHKYAKMFPKAGFGIVVCGNTEKQNKRGFLVSDCSAAIQNMLLAAHGMDLGAVWCGIYGKDENDEYVVNIKKLLNLPDHIIPIGLVVVGTKGQEREAQGRFDEAKIHYDKW